MWWLRADTTLERASQRISGLDVGEARALTKAFATYFDLTNLAENNHRKRRLRAAEVLPGHPAKPGSLAGLRRTLKSRCAGD